MDGWIDMYRTHTPLCPRAASYIAPSLRVLSRCLHRATGPTAAAHRVPLQHALSPAGGVLLRARLHLRLGRGRCYTITSLLLCYCTTMLLYYYTGIVASRARSAEDGAILLYHYATILLSYYTTVLLSTQTRALSNQTRAISTTRHRAQVPRDVDRWVVPAAARAAGARGVRRCPRWGGGGA